MIKKIINEIIALLTLLSGFFLLVSILFYFMVLFSADSSSLWSLLKFIFLSFMSYFLAIIVLGSAIHMNMNNKTEEKNYFKNFRYILFCTTIIIIIGYVEWDFLLTQKIGNIYFIDIISKLNL